MRNLKAILLLIDIDGTLLHSRGAGKRAMEAAFQEVFGPGPGLENIDMRGMLDPMIVRKGLAQRGDPDELLGSMWPAFVEAYTTRLRRESEKRGAWSLTPGTRTFLASAPPCARLGLLTGNMREGADIKMEVMGLERFFPTGGFGEDGETRDAVAKAAARRCSEHYGIDFAPDRTAVIGDTPLDVSCGKAIGAWTIGISSGFTDGEALEQAGADRVVDDFNELLREDVGPSRFLFWPLDHSRQEQDCKPEN